MLTHRLRIYKNISFSILFCRDIKSKNKKKKKKEKKTKTLTLKICNLFKSYDMIKTEFCAYFQLPKDKRCKTSCLVYRPTSIKLRKDKLKTPWHYLVYVLDDLAPRGNPINDVSTLKETLFEIFIAKHTSRSCSHHLKSLDVHKIFGWQILILAAKIFQGLSYIYFLSNRVESSLRDQANKQFPKTHMNASCLN